MGFFNKKWINVTVKADDERYVELVNEQNKMISEALDMIPTSDILGMLSELGLEDEQMEDAKKIVVGYKNMLTKYLELNSTAYDMAIERDNRIRNIEKQNAEILKKLDDISKKIK